MLDMSWGEVMLIGGVALIVIGPKDLPKALRTVGQITTKLRRMAGEFQSQFNEAMREADLDEVRREVEGVGRTTAGFNPVQTIRNEIKGAVDGAGSKPSGETLAQATAQLRAETSAAEAEAASPEIEPTIRAPAPSAPSPSVDGAPLVAPESAAGLDPAAPPATPESVPAAPAPAMPAPHP